VKTSPVFTRGEAAIDRLVADHPFALFLSVRDADLHAIAAAAGTRARDGCGKELVEHIGQVRPGPQVRDDPSPRVDVLVHS
jgi:hypothetical protein